MSHRTQALVLAQRAGLSAPPRHSSARRHQGGAIIITVALALLFLLGFMAIAVDFGRLFVVKTELQTAVDSCALAAAAELDGGPDALNRARSAGLTVGNLNKVHFQGSSAGIQASDTDATVDDILFSDQLAGSYSSTFSFETAKYAKCEHARTGLAPWLLQAMTAFTGNGKFSEDLSVAAVAVATRAPAQTVCAIPVQITPKLGSSGPHYGFRPRQEWIPVLYDENSTNDKAPDPGHFGWASLDPARDTTPALKEQLLGNGVCDLNIEGEVGTPGTKFAASVEWNSRFGLYTKPPGSNEKSGTSIDTATPDLTGYSFTEKNSTIHADVISEFLEHRAMFHSYGETIDTVDRGDEITGLSINGGYRSTEMATYQPGERALSTHGGNRRLVLAPFVLDRRIVDWACILMLHPIDKPKTTVYVEYVGNASDKSSPCSSLGLAGGDVGPLVPVLVR